MDALQVASFKVRKKAKIRIDSLIAYLHELQRNTVYLMVKSSLKACKFRESDM